MNPLLSLSFHKSHLEYFLSLFPLDTSSHTIGTQKCLSYLLSLEKDKTSLLDSTTLESTTQGLLSRPMAQNTAGPYSNTSPATKEAIREVYQWLQETYEDSPKANNSTTATGAPSQSSSLGSPINLSTQGSSATLGPHSLLPTSSGHGKEAQAILISLLNDTFRDLFTNSTITNSSNYNPNSFNSSATNTRNIPLATQERILFLRKKWSKLQTSARTTLHTKPKKNPLCITKDLLMKKRK